MIFATVCWDGIQPLSSFKAFALQIHLMNSTAISKHSVTCILQTKIENEGTCHPQSTWAKPKAQNTNLVYDFPGGPVTLIPSLAHTI